MNISGINQLGNAKEIAQTGLNGNEGQVGGTSFANVLDKTFSEVNDLMQAADKATQNMAIGRSENLHEAMIATEKAETALKFLVQVRNKAIEAYHEIMRMQV